MQGDFDECQRMYLEMRDICVPSKEYVLDDERVACRPLSYRRIRDGDHLVVRRPGMPSLGWTVSLQDHPLRQGGRAGAHAENQQGQNCRLLHSLVGGGAPRRLRPEEKRVRHHGAGAPDRRQPDGDHGLSERLRWMRRRDAEGVRGSDGWLFRTDSGAGRCTERAVRNNERLRPEDDGGAQPAHR